MADASARFICPRCRAVVGPDHVRHRGTRCTWCSPSTDMVELEEFRRQEEDARYRQAFGLGHVDPKEPPR